MSVTETFVKDHLDFFRIFSEASLDLAFSIPWQIVNVPDLRLGKYFSCSLFKPSMESNRMSTSIILVYRAPILDEFH